MKQTEFQFEIRLASDDAQSILKSLQAKLHILKGINSVTATENKTAVALTLSASFEDTDQAKRLHRKVMNTIIAQKGVTISQATTKLTDIF